MGFFHLLSANFLIQLITFSSGLFVAWILTPEQIGQIKVLQTYSGVAIILAGLGFNTSTLKLCSEKRSPGEKSYLYNRAFQYTFFTVGISYLIFTTAALLGFISTDPVINQLFPFYFIALLPNTINNLQIAYLQALKRIKEMAKIQSITKLFSVVFIIGLTYFFNIYGFIASTIIGASITLILMNRKTRQINQHNPEEPLQKAFTTHWFYAKFSFLANALGYIGSYLDIFILNYVISDREDLGYYSFAVTLILGLRLITATVQQITTPYFSEKSMEINEWKRIFKKYNNLFLLLSIVISILAYFGIGPVLHFLFSGKYDASAPYFQLLTITWFIRNLYVLRGVAIWGLGRINMNFYASLIAFPVNVGIMYLAISKYSTIGAAYGSIASAMFSFLVVLIIFKIVVRQEMKKNRL